MYIVYVEKIFLSQLLLQQFANIRYVLRNESNTSGSDISLRQSGCIILSDLRHNNNCAAVF